MEWTDWIGKEVFIKLRDGTVYSFSLVTDVDISSPPLIWITIKDKFEKEVTIIHSEIVRIKEEGSND